MSSFATILVLIVAGFAVYTLFRDRIFDTFEMEPFVAPPTTVSQGVPAPAPLLVRQAPIYPERETAPSGPSSPAQAAPSEEVVVYGPPQASDPYDEPQESSAIPETLRHPERAYRPAPSAHHTSLARDSGVASEVASGPGVRSTELIQNGGQFMEGVYANDSFEDANFSSF
jgi:hypothetical protein